jgi:hypothetical protein
MNELVGLRKRSTLVAAAAAAGPVGLGSKRIIDIILATTAIILLAPL